MKKTLTLAAVAVATLFAGCATTHTPPTALIDARNVVQQAQADPMVLDHAALELKKATDALSRAERLNADGEKLGDIESAAYVAKREAQTAMTLAQAKRNEASIKAAELDRERARADARAQEAGRAQAQAAAARAAATAARTEAASARFEASVAQQQADSARSQAVVAQAQASDAEMRAQAAREQAAQAQIQTVVLQQQLIELQAQVTDRGTLVTLGDVLFETGRADIKPTAQEAMGKLAAYLNEHPDRMVLIEGYTDSVGDESYNQTLSQRRAEAVAIALAALGIGPNRIATRGYGESYPVADNASVSNRALNRRVEVYISHNSQPVRARG